MVKKGYKQTEVGVIPEDWDISSLKDVSVGRFTYGVNAPAVPYEPPFPNYIRITDISDDGHFMRENRTSVDCPTPEVYTLKENDIVFARTGASTGKTYLYQEDDGDLVYAGFLIKASILPEKANSKYVFGNLHTNRYWDWVAVTSMRSGQPGINGHEYASYVIPLPPLPEQQCIAEVLSDVDSLIFSLEKLLAKYKSIKAACLQQMFPQNGETVPRMRLPGFTDAWEQRKVLSCIQKITDFRGRTPKKLGMDWSESGYLALSALNVKDGYIDFSQDVHYGDQALYDKWMSGNELHKGQVLFTTEAPMGNVAQVPDNRQYILSQRTIAFDVREDIITENFLATLLRSPAVFNTLTSLSSGGTAKGVSQKSLAGVDVRIPVDLREQTLLATYFHNIDHLITLYQRKLKKVQKIKQGMMQQLLTGKIRLV